MRIRRESKLFMSESAGAKTHLTAAAVYFHIDRGTIGPKIIESWFLKQLKCLQNIAKGLKSCPSVI